MEPSKIAPELRKAARKATMLPLDAAWGRGLAQTLLGLVPPAKVEGVRIEVRTDTPAPLRIYRPDTRRSDAAAFWIHGGGYLIGRAVQDDRPCAETAKALGIVVVSVDYRLGAFPGPLDDCHAGWTWLQKEAAQLGVDPARVVLGGQSAGGGLAAGLAQRLTDEGRARPLAQWLFSPMLDDRTAARRELDAVAHPVWNNRLNRLGWRTYLGVEPGAAQIPAYASAARREDLAGLPPAWIGVGDVDLFCAEDRIYAERLRAAGVAVAFEEVAGAPHGFEAWAPDMPIARSYFERARAWLQGVITPT